MSERQPVVSTEAVGDGRPADEFLAGRALAQRGAGRRALESLFPPNEKAPTPEPPVTSPAAPAAAEAAAKPPSGISVSAPGVPEAPAETPMGLVMTMLPAGANLLVAPLALAHGAIAAAKDIGKGVIEAPHQIAGGAIDFVNNLMRFADNGIRQAENAGMPNAYFRLFDEQGHFAPAVESEEHFRDAQAAGQEHIFQIPTTADPETVTGQFIRTAVPFLLGRGGSGGALSKIPVAPLSEAARDFVSGAVSQNPGQPRLSNVIDQIVPNFATDFLKARPEDEDSLLGNLKSGLEFTGLGAAFGGIAQGVKALKGELAGEPEALTALGQGPIGQTQATPMTVGGKPLGTPSEGEGAEPQRDIIALGDPLAPAVEVRPTAREAGQAEVTLGRLDVGAPTAAGFPEEEGRLSDETIHAYLAGARVDNPIKVNLARIGSPEDIGDVLAQVSRTIPAQAVQTNEATIAAADALGLTPENFLAGYQGRNLDAAQTTAMRFMLDSSASQLIDFAKAARDPLATPEAQGQFLRAFSVHRSLQDYFENARAEAGRTLQAWSIMSQQRAGYERAIGDLVRTTDAQGDLSGMAQRIADLDNPLQVGRFVASSTQGSARDGLLKIWYNALLSSPTTIVKKIASDIGMATWNVATTALAEKFGSGSVPEGEAGQLLAGYTGSFRDALRAGGRALRTGQSQFYREYQTLDWLGKAGGSPDEMAQRASQNFRLSALANGAPDVMDPSQPTVAGWEFMRSLMPTSWIGAADDFAKVWNYRSELRRLAWRAADGDADQFAHLLDQPPQALHQQAIGAALKTTFQEPLQGIGASIQNVVDAMEIPLPHTDFRLPLGRMILPFTKVPLNITKAAYENSPLAVAFPTRAVTATLQGPPTAARDILMARIGLGTGVSLGLADLAMNNYLTGRGPSEPRLRSAWVAAGNQPYSLQFPGKRPVAINQLEPFGMVASAIADTFNTIRFAEDADTGRLASSLAMGVGNAMLSKTYFEGVARALDALEHPETEGPRWSNAFATGFVPQLAARVSNATDDWQRAHYGMIDAIEARLPFIRHNLPVQRTWLGDPVPEREAFFPLLSGTPAAQVVSPMAMGRPLEEMQPIDRWIWQNQNAFGRDYRGFPQVPTKPSRTQAFTPKGAPELRTEVELSPQLYDRFVQLAGDEIKDPQTGLGLKGSLNALVTGQFPNPGIQEKWNAAAPEDKAFVINSRVQMFRQAARMQLRSEYPELEDTLQAAWRARGEHIQAGRGGQ